ncbi:hypothetical protein EJO66_22600 [Variovorax beijingensis]|uniref:Aminoglycoside phosphotransferase family enzyme n=1 Tax=Variovorax beijingensis TaxID=2496117 RepID=A0ABY0A2A3_9BURK|nr:hypothetical protein [Variovorax beijingensis]RSZ32041.1 hypothetical protein EJO66_22600 [Variovorax beijingensis]
METQATPAPLPSAAAGRPADRAPDIEAKLRCLESFLAANDAGARAQRIETHMSWVLVGKTQVLKLKKPVVYPPVDYSSVEARECNARRELRLNRRLAPDVYLGLLALQWQGGRLSAVAEAYLQPGRQTVDWVVVMRRLPQDRMLDELIRRRELGPEDIDALGATLAAFYRSAVRAAVDEGEYVARLRHGIALSARIFERAAFALPRVREACQATDEALTLHEGLLRARVAEGRLVEGHGDLRAEHVCLVEPPAVFDALEFDARLGEVDPFDELCFLGLECDMAGDASIGPLLCTRIAAALGDAPAPALLRLYTAKNALMRARLSVAHLMEPDPRHPEKWLPQASRYLKRALMALAGS